MIRFIEAVVVLGSFVFFFGGCSGGPAKTENADDADVSREATTQEGLEIDSNATPSIKGIAIGTRPMIDQDLAANAISEPKLSLVIDALKRNYSGVVADRRAINSSYHNANISFDRLFNFWSPNGLSVDQLKEIVGDPDVENLDGIVYEFDTGWSTRQRVFKLDQNGRIQAPKASFDFGSESHSASSLAILKREFMNSVKVREVLKSSKGSEFYYANSALNNLLLFWSPNGLSVDQLKEIIGDSDRESSDEIIYEFDTGNGGVRERIFKVKEGLIEMLDEGRLK